MWTLAFILLVFLLPFTGITPKENDPLLVIHEVTQSCKSVYQRNEGKKKRRTGDMLQIPGFDPLDFYRCSYNLKRVTLVAQDSRSPLEATHTFSFREK